MAHVHYLDALRPERYMDTAERLLATIAARFPSCNLLCGRGLSGAMIIPYLATRREISWGDSAQERRDAF